MVLGWWAPPMVGGGRSWDGGSLVRPLLLPCCLPPALSLLETASSLLSSSTATMRICDSEENRRKLAWLVPGYILLAWFFCVVFQVGNHVWLPFIHLPPTDQIIVDPTNSQTIFSRWASPLYPGMGTTMTTTMSRCTRSSTYRTTLK